MARDKFYRSIGKPTNANILINQHRCGRRFHHRWLIFQFRKYNLLSHSHAKQYARTEHCPVPPRDYNQTKLGTSIVLCACSISSNDMGDHVLPAICSKSFVVSRFQTVHVERDVCKWKIHSHSICGSGGGGDGSTGNGRMKVKRENRKVCT